MSKKREDEFSLPDRKIALAMLSLGMSRESVSRYLGKSINAIDVLFIRDSEFAKEVMKSEEESEQYYISRLRQASQDPRAWRAAAWITCPNLDGQ